MTDVPVDLAASRYQELLDDVLGEVRQAGDDLVRSTNALMIDLYWRIGRLIVERRAIEGYALQ